MATREMTLLDGTEVRVGDKVRAKGEGCGLRVCTVLEIMKGTGVDKAILSAPTPFGTVIRSRYQIKRLPRSQHQNRERLSRLGLHMRSRSVA